MRGNCCCCINQDAKSMHTIQRIGFLFQESPGKRRRKCGQWKSFQFFFSASLVFLLLCPAAYSSSHSLRSRTLNPDTAKSRRANTPSVDDESEIEIVLDHEGRIPGGILPDSPKPANLNYGFRSFPNYLDLTSQKVCSAQNHYPVICGKNSV
jgi:hypothetical protein